MQRIKTSKYGEIIKEKGRYFKTHFNAHTGAVEIEEIVFDKNGRGESKTSSGGCLVHDKTKTDIIFEMQTAQ